MDLMGCFGHRKKHIEMGRKETEGRQKGSFYTQRKSEKSVPKLGLRYPSSRPMFNEKIKPFLHSDRCTVTDLLGLNVERVRRPTNGSMPRALSWYVWYVLYIVDDFVDER